MEGGLTYTQTFDAENRLISVTVSGQTTQFIYDGNGNLVKKIKPDGSRTIYVGGLYEVDKNSGGTVTKTTVYYPLAGAMRVNGTLYYVLKDHLGSASVVTDSSGNVVGDPRYYPFGFTRLASGSMYTDKLFTGQREMAGLGIYHFGARFYSPYTNRFLSADTVVPNPSDPQAFNRYSYVLGNPLLYVDPSGHFTCSSDRTSDDYCPGRFPTVPVTTPQLPPPPPPPSKKCQSDCYDAYLTYTEVVSQLGYVPSVEEILCMTANAEFGTITGYEGVREFGQEGLARNYYEQCPDLARGCQGDGLYNFLSAYQPWGDKKGVENNAATPAHRAQDLISTLSSGKPELWGDVALIVDVNYASRLPQEWTTGKWDGQPWQWFGPMSPSQSCRNKVTPYIKIENQDGTEFWMLFAEEDANFGKYCP